MDITAIILAGNRPGGDPLARAAGVATKALVPVAGRPMIEPVARALLSHPRVGTVVVMTQQPEVLAQNAQTEWLTREERVVLSRSCGGISQSLLDWIGTNPTVPVLVTTADNVLLNHEMINALVAGAGDADIAAAMVERRVLMRAYPESRRTWLRFRGGAWSGANLFWLGSPRAARVLEKWRAIEQDRKKGWKIVLAFGPALLIAAALRLLTVHRAIARAGRRLGVTARIVTMPMAEACIDADKPEDIVLIERILAQRDTTA